MRHVVALLLMLVTGIVVRPAPAAADQTIDAIECLRLAQASIGMPNAAPAWPDLPRLTYSVASVPACASFPFRLYREGQRHQDLVGASGSFFVRNQNQPTADQPLIHWTVRVETSQGSKVLATTEERYVAFPTRLPGDAPDVTITANSTDQRILFVRAVQTPGATVRVAGTVDLDLSGLESLVVAPGVRLLGDRTVNPSGPRVFTTTFPRWLLTVGRNGQPSDYVRITDIRLDGGMGTDAYAGVGTEDAEGIAVYASRYVEIDHNEIYGWRGAGVSVRDGNNADSATYVGRLNQDNANSVSVHDNDIHHNQHPTTSNCYLDGDGHATGYGVVVFDGAYATIERNSFNWNRHAIAGDGKHGTGYIATDNVIGAAGGIHAKCSGAVFYTHAIDMHGRGDCGVSDHNCGPAGEYMNLEYNTVFYTSGNAVKLRGTPGLGGGATPGVTKVGMYLSHNVFRESDPGDALHQNETGMHESLNTFGVEPGERTTCDFDADGTVDPFVATGATWWYRSSVLGGRWQFLYRSPLRVESISLGDVDGDRRCDMTAGGETVLNPGPLPVLAPAARKPADVVQTVGTPVTVDLTASGGVAPYTWTVTGLPPGVSATAAGRVSGTAVPGGTTTWTVTATVTDAGNHKSTVTFQWTVVATVPAVLGWDEASARQAITAANLTVGTVSRRNNCVSPGDVILQSPSGGVTRPVGTAVNITVSTCTGGGDPK